MRKIVSLRVNGEALVFDMTTEIYNKYIDETQLNKKVGPARNLLMRAVKPESREALKALVDLPGVGLQIVNHLVEEFSPDIEVTVGE